VTGSTVDEDERDTDGQTTPEPRTDRVRIVGAQRAAGSSEPAQPTDGEEERPQPEPGFGPQDWETAPEIPPLPHWTEAPTGEVPAVLSRRPDDDPWSSVPEPTWREEGADWEQGDPFAPSLYAGSDEPLRPLDEDDLSDRQPWSFDLGEPASGEDAVEASGPGTRGRPSDDWDDQGPTGHGEDPSRLSLDEPGAQPPILGPDEIAGEATEVIELPRSSHPGPDERAALAEDIEAAGGRWPWRMPRRRSRADRFSRHRHGVEEGLAPGEPWGTGDADGSVSAAAPVHAADRLDVTSELPAVRGRLTDEETEERAEPEDTAGRHADVGPERARDRPLETEPGAADRPVGGRGPAGLLPRISSSSGLVRPHAGPSGRGAGQLPPDAAEAGRLAARRVPGSEPAQEPAADGRDMPVAVASGVVIGVAVLVFFHFGTVPAMVIVTAVVTLAAMEAFAAFRRGGYHPATLLGLVAVVSLMVATYNKGQKALPLVLVLLVAFTLLWHLAGVDRRADPVRSTAATLLVFSWVGVFGSFAALLLSPSLFPDRHGIAYLLGALIAAVAYDVGALIAGAWLGRHPLSTVSPNKTWEGIVGGTVAALVLALVIVHLIHPWTLGKAVALGLVVSVVSPVGDLGESLVKRHLGLKDMGRILPGHGGLLDRIDGLLFVLPATFYLLRAFHLG
jgi:CDP-diglyceride synthetase